MADACTGHVLSLSLASCVLLSFASRPARATAPVINPGRYEGAFAVANPMEAS